LAFFGSRSCTELAIFSKSCLALECKSMSFETP
jgi:hypothetical protein